MVQTSHTVPTEKQVPAVVALDLTQEDHISTVQDLGPEAKRAWISPVLEPLGAWSALTLQQSIPISPDGIPLPFWYGE